MDPALEAAFRVLDELRAAGIPSGPVALSREYRRAVERVEAMPANQSGADKTWVSDADRDWRSYFARVERMR